MTVYLQEVGLTSLSKRSVPVLNCTNQKEKTKVLLKDIKRFRETKSKYSKTSLKVKKIFKAKTSCINKSEFKTKMEIAH